MPDESYRRRIRSLLLCLCHVFRALINSLGVNCARALWATFCFIFVIFSAYLGKGTHSSRKSSATHHSCQCMRRFSVYLGKGTYSSLLTASSKSSANHSYQCLWCCSVYLHKAIHLNRKRVGQIQRKVARRWYTQTETILPRTTPPPPPPPLQHFLPLLHHLHHHHYHYHHHQIFLSSLLPAGTFVSGKHH